MSHITQIRDYAAWTENLDGALEVETVSPNIIQITGGGSRITLSMPAARQLAAVLVRLADEARPES